MARVLTLIYPLLTGNQTGHVVGSGRDSDKILDSAAVTDKPSGSLMLKENQE